MKWILAVHLIFVISWFAGLFYLPRLYVYHAQTEDEIGLARFVVMERKLYYGIMWPAAVLTTLSGLWLWHMMFAALMMAPWFHAKLGCVLLLWVFHLSCGYYRKQFATGKNQHSHVFYRWFNEVPTILLIAIVLLVVGQPSL